MGISSRREEEGEEEEEEEERRILCRISSLFVRGSGRKRLGEVRAFEGACSRSWDPASSSRC
jgi:hypothetical protein